MQAERDSVNQKAAEYLSERLGEEYGGVISGFSPAGIYVQLPSTIEGMVPFRSMQGFLVYDEDRMQAVNSSSGRVYRLGEAVSVQVARVDVIRRRIDFELLAPQGRPENRGRTGENVRTKKKTAPGRQRSKRRRPT